MPNPQVQPRTSKLARAAGRGRPKDAAVDERVLVAVVAELADVGVSGFSVNSVSARARVGKRSIASRWPDRHSLILAGMATLAADLDSPRTGSLSGDLEVLAGRIAEMMAEPRRSVLTRCAAELRKHPEYYATFQRDSVDRCMAVVQDVLVDARKRGELADGLDVSRAAEFFVGAIMGTHAFTSPRPGGTGPIGPLVELITHGLGVTIPAALPPMHERKKPTMTTPSETTMRAAVLHGPHDVRVEQVTRSRILRPDDAIVAITASCVCGSDLHPYRAGLGDRGPKRAGHEFVGVVEEVGEAVRSLSVGDVVVAPFAISDGTCRRCRQGVTTSCEHGSFWVGPTVSATPSTVGRASTPASRSLMAPSSSSLGPSRTPWCRTCSRCPT